MALLTIVAAFSLVAGYAKGDRFDLDSVSCAIMCPWDPSNGYNHCEQGGYKFTNCAKKCPPSPPLAFVLKKNPRYVDLGCSLRNDSAVGHALDRFRNDCDVTDMDIRKACSGLLQCLTAIRAVRAREQLTETELKLNGIAEIGIVVDYIAVNMVAGNEQIPAKCAALFPETRH